MGKNQKKKSVKSKKSQKILSHSTKETNSYTNYSNLTTSSSNHNENGNTYQNENGNPSPLNEGLKNNQFYNCPIYDTNNDELKNSIFNKEFIFPIDQILFINIRAQENSNCSKDDKIRSGESDEIDSDLLNEQISLNIVRLDDLNSRDDNGKNQSDEQEYLDNFGEKLDKNLTTDDSNQNSSENVSSYSNIKENSKSQTISNNTNNKKPKFKVITDSKFLEKQNKITNQKETERSEKKRAKNKEYYPNNHNNMIDKIKTNFFEYILEEINYHITENRDKFEKNIFSKLKKNNSIDFNFELFEKTLEEIFEEILEQRMILN